MTRVAAGVLAVILVTVPAVAEVSPDPHSADPRIRSVLYNPHDVVEIVGHVGYATTVFFAESEQVRSIALGDDAWHVAPEGNRISIKPRSDLDLPGAAGRTESDTNMTVFTDRRSYFFELRASRRREPEQMTYAVRFRYPRDRERGGEGLRRETGARRLSTGVGRSLEAAVSGAGNPRRHWHYSWQGSPALRPLAAFDDSRFSYLKMPAGAPLPAVFTAEADGQETIANFHLRGSWLVVHRVARKLVLRDGALVTCVFREETGQ